MTNVAAEAIAEYLRLELRNATALWPKGLVGSVSTLDEPRPRSLIFIAPERSDLQLLDGLPECLLIVPPAFAGRPSGPYMVSEDSRSSFAAAMACFFAYPRPEPGIAPTAVIEHAADIAPSATIGHYCVVSSGAKIGPEVWLRHHVVISANVHIGAGTTIKSGTIIGEDGFGPFRDPTGALRLMPHLGGVRIGEGVEIGALNTVCSGTIEPTVVGNFVKTDDHVHIAHNNIIGEGTVITACVELSGSVNIGKGVWLGPNSSVMNGIKIGDRAFIGLGSVVTSNVPVGARIAGSPARSVEELKRRSKLLQKLGIE